MPAKAGIHPTAAYGFIGHRKVFEGVDPCLRKDSETKIHGFLVLAMQRQALRWHNEYLDSAQNARIFKYVLGHLSRQSSLSSSYFYSDLTAPCRFFKA